MRQGNVSYKDAIAGKTKAFKPNLEVLETSNFSFLESQICMHNSKSPQLLNLIQKKVT
tara:strand:- start:124 stop:297 length:174 start_codon:yes stop_codon:yes gene_type:complete